MSNMPYSTFGRGTSAIVFIHGFLDGSAVWEDVIHHLDPELEATKIAVDLAGMGANARATGPRSLERYTSDVSALVAELGKPVVLVGQSMGTQIAELVARAHPTKVRGLVLLTPVPLAGTQIPEEGAAPFKSLGGNLEAQRQARKQLSHDLSATHLARFDALGANVTKDGSAAIVDAWNRGHEAGKEKSEFQGPVLVVRGAADGFSDAAMASAVAARFAHAEQAVVEKAGHWSHVEQPAAVAQLVSRFVRERAGGGAARAADWTGAFARKSENDFKNAFAEDVVLDATVLAKPVVGRESLGLVMGTASKIYTFLEFGKPTTNGHKEYVEWVARLPGTPEVLVSGVTILTRNEAGQIAHAAIHHRPLRGALRFANLLAAELNRQNALDASYFFLGPQADAFLKG